MFNKKFLIQMKKVLMAVALAATMFAAENANGQTFNDGTLVYTVIYGTTNVIVGDYGVTRYANGLVAGTSYLGSVTVPSTVTHGGITYSVTEIGDWAFYNCNRLTSVNLPNSITNIDFEAFRACNGLTSITFPNSVTFMEEQVFLDCQGLTSITLPNSLTEIANGTFYGCSNLTSVTIPNSITTIGASAFFNCINLPSITIPNSVTTIGLGAFVYCHSLTSVTIPNSVTSIDEGAFSDCNGLTSITVGSSVSSIGNIAFGYCINLTSINVDANNPNFSSNDGILYNKVQSTLIQCPGGRTGSVTVPNSVTTIGQSAFINCIGLTSITVPNSVTTIGQSAFEYCIGLTSITVPNSVTTIGQYAFSGTTWFNNMPDGVVYINNVLYIYKGTMPNNTTININEGTVSISPSAFAGCIGLTSITIGNAVTSIGEWTFYGCGRLTSITIGNSVTTIGQSAFQYCSGLTSITIGNAVTTIDWYAFASCRGLTEITSLAVNPPALGMYVFSSVSKTIPVNVPCGSEADYQAATGWSDFTNYTGCIITNSLNNIDDVNVSVYPNPTNDRIFIEGKDFDKVVIVDILGRAAATYNGGKEINISNLPNGVYSVRIIADNKTIAARKIVKK
jgi:hypothetical protein